MKWALSGAVLSMSDLMAHAPAAEDAGYHSIGAGLGLPPRGGLRRPSPCA